MNETALLVSVIIPNYNHSKFIADRIESVLNQTYPNIEIIILDDCSTDNSQEIIEYYRDSEKIKAIVYNQINSGSVFKQWQMGLLYAKGKFVWIAESDDLSRNNFLEQLIPLFQDDDVALAYSRSIDIDDGGQKLGLSYSQYEWCNFSFVKEGIQEITDHLLFQCTIPNVSAVVFRRDVLREAYFNHDFKLCGDWYFYIRILETGKVAYLSEPLNFHRFHSGTVRSKSLRSLSILDERLEIVTGIIKRNKVTLKHRLKAIWMQIELYVNEVRLQDIAGRNAIELVKVIVKYNLFFAVLFPIIICKRICRRFF